MPFMLLVIAFSTIWKSREAPPVLLLDPSLNRSWLATKGVAASQREADAISHINICIHLFLCWIIPENAVCCPQLSMLTWRPSILAVYRARMQALWRKLRIVDGMWWTQVRKPVPCTIALPAFSALPSSSPPGSFPSYCMTIAYFSLK